MKSSAPSPEERPLRLFLAIRLPPSLRIALAKQQETLRRSLRGPIRWVAPSGMHLTLQFLGNVPPGLIQPLAAAMDKAAQAVNPFDLRIAGTGVFPGGRAPRVVWVGLEGDLEELFRLQAALRDAVEAVGLPRERRPFQPHLTLARVGESMLAEDRERLVNELRGLAIPPSSPSLPVRSIDLMQSTLMPTGALYTSLASSALGNPSLEAQ